MRKLTLGFVALLPLFLGPGAARAAGLGYADLSVNALGHPLQIQGSAALVGSAIPPECCGTYDAYPKAAYLYAGSGFATTLTAPLSAPFTRLPGSSMSLKIGANGALFATQSQVQITAPIQGSVRVVNPLYGTVLAIPLALGAKGTSTRTEFGGLVRVSVIGSAWHLGSVRTTGTFTQSGVVLPTHTIATTGSFNLDVGGAGTVKLVSLSHVIVSGVSASNQVSVNSLTLLFLPDADFYPPPQIFLAPEPGTLLLLGAFGAGIAGLRKRRRAA